VHAYSYQLTTTGGTAPYRYQLQSGGLPPGLTLSATGLISGMPSSPGTYTFTVYVSDSSDPAQAGEVTLTISVT
jgi:hypothetical protein